MRRRLDEVAALGRRLSPLPCRDRGWSPLGSARSDMGQFGVSADTGGFTVPVALPITPAAPAVAMVSRPRRRVLGPGAAATPDRWVSRWIPPMLVSAAFQAND